MNIATLSNPHVVAGQASPEYLQKQDQCCLKICFILTSTHFAVNKQCFLEEDCGTLVGQNL